MKLIKAYVIAIVAFGFLGGLGVEGLPLILLGSYIVLLPSYMFMGWLWKSYRFLQLPTPIQLLKGFIKQWDFVRKGPVVTRVHRPRQSSRTP